ncbi:MAG: hypothetical protein SGI86_15165 [Deltaproteobacteria bacterium]|nr:hypothetical protein [Deltaproteobacteria bacterium]
MKGIRNAGLLFSLASLTGCGGDSEPAEMTCGDSDDGELGANNELATSPQVKFGQTVRGCVDGQGDKDFYYFTAGSNKAGGFVTAELVNKGGSRVQLSFYLVEGTGLIRTFESAPMEGLTGYLAVVPAVQYGVRVSHSLVTDFPSGGYGYELKLKHTDVEDRHEPNDFEASPASIGKNSPIKARMFAGHEVPPVPRTAIDPPLPVDYDDWYKVKLNAGTAGIAVSDVPKNVAVRIELRDPKGNEIACPVSSCIGMTGMDLVVEPIPVTAGEHLLRVTRIGQPEVEAAAIGVTPPVNFTDDYVVEVRQE